MTEKFEKLLEARDRQEKAQPAIVQFLRVVREQEEKQRAVEHVESTPVVLFSYR
jgi:methyl coenzyme M reductase subunit C-like uncharacterized protein (methanogenesis marker protein 7)